MTSSNNLIRQRLQVPLMGLNQQDKLSYLMGSSLMAMIVSGVSGCGTAHMHTAMKPFHRSALGSAQAGDGAQPG